MKSFRAPLAASKSVRGTLQKVGEEGPKKKYSLFGRWQLLLKDGEGESR